MYSLAKNRVIALSLGLLLSGFSSSVHAFSTTPSMFDPLPFSRVTRVLYMIQAYGLSPAFVSWRYEIPRGRDSMVLIAAHKHNDAELKQDLLLLNESLLGKDWRKIRPALAYDFVQLNRLSFVMKHGAETRERIMYLMNVYGASGSLYFKAADLRTYLQPYMLTTTSSKEYFMYELDRVLGIL